MTGSGRPLDHKNMVRSGLRDEATIAEVAKRIESRDDLDALGIEIPMRYSIKNALKLLEVFSPTWSARPDLVGRLRRATTHMTNSALATAIRVHPSYARLIRDRRQPSMTVALRWATVVHRQGGPDLRLGIRVPRVRQSEHDRVRDFERRFHEVVLKDLLERAGYASDADYIAFIQAMTAGLTWSDATRRFQRRFLEREYAAAEGKPSETARRLGLARSHVNNLLNAMQIRAVAGASRPDKG